MSRAKAVNAYAMRIADPTNGTTPEYGAGGVSGSVAAVPHCVIPAPTIPKVVPRTAQLERLGAHQFCRENVRQQRRRGRQRHLRGRATRLSVATQRPAAKLFGSSNVAPGDSRT